MVNGLTTQTHRCTDYLRTFDELRASQSYAFTYVPLTSTFATNVAINRNGK